MNFGPRLQRLMQACRAQMWSLADEERGIQVSAACFVIRSSHSSQAGLVAAAAKQEGRTRRAGWLRTRASLPRRGTATIESQMMQPIFKSACFAGRRQCEMKNAQRICPLEGQPQERADGEEGSWGVSNRPLATRLLLQQYYPPAFPPGKTLSLRP